MNRNERALRYADFVSRLERQGPRPAYLFLGPESLLRDHALRDLTNKLSESGTRKIEIEHHQGGETPLAQIIMAFSTVGFFAPTRLVIVSNIEKYGRAGARERDELIATLTNAGPGSHLVAVSEMDAWEFERKNVFCKSLLAALSTVEFQHPRPAEALQWIQAETVKLGVKLDPDAAALLLEKIGPHLQELARELEKLSLWADPGTRISAEMLRDLIRGGVLGSSGELTQAVLEGRAGEALHHWSGLNGSEPVLRLAWLLQQKARERLVQAKTADPRLEDLALRLYAMEKGIKTGMIPSAGEDLAFELAMIASCPAPGSKRPTRG